VGKGAPFVGALAHVSAHLGLAQLGNRVGVAAVLAPLALLRVPAHGRLELVERLLGGSHGVD